MELYIVDAFTDRRFSGNQAGVALLGEGPWPPEELMGALAGELKHSETAFVRAEGPGVFSLRYFTPAGEVDLCGHATVAAFTALRERAGLPPGPCTARTAAGELGIQVEHDAVWMDMAAPREVRDFTESEEAELYAAYGLDRSVQPAGFRAQSVSTGLPDILLPVDSAGALNGAVQDEGAVTALSRRYGVVGVHMFWPCLDGEAACRCRNFAPLYAIGEEAATGTASGALTYYLHRRGLIVPGSVNRFIQGERMGKPSEILTRLTGGPGVRIQVGGRAVIALRAQLLDQ